MTVSTSTRRVSYTLDGVTTSFPIPFKFKANGDIRAVYATAAGVETALVLNVDYTLTGAGLESGGALALTRSQTSGDKLVIKRVVQRVQSVVYTPNDPFPAKTHEGALDLLTMMSQEDGDELQRALRVSESDAGLGAMILPMLAARAGKLLGFNEAGLPISIALTQLAIQNYLGLQAGATERSALLKISDRMDARDYGVRANGSTDDTAAWRLAIAAAEAENCPLYGPPGISILSDELVIDQPGFVLHGAGRGGPTGLARATTFRMTVANKTVLRVGTSYVTIDDFAIDAQAANVRGVAIVPVDEAQLTTLTYQNYCIVDRFYIAGCDTAVAVRAGPDVGGADSQAFYSAITNGHLLNNHRGMLFQSPTEAGSSPANAHFVQSVRIGSEGTSVGNVGIEVEGGDTILLHRASFEGLVHSGAHAAVPTAIIIAQTDAVSGLDNNYNVIDSCRFEACTRDLDIANPRTIVTNSPTLKNSKCVFSNGFPILNNGGDVSQLGAILPGYFYQNVSTVPNVDLDTFWIWALNGLATPRIKRRTANTAYNTIELSRFVGNLSAGVAANLTLTDVFDPVRTYRVGNGFVKLTGIVGGDTISAEWSFNAEIGAGPTLTEGYAVKRSEEACTGVNAGTTGGTNFAATLIIASGALALRVTSTGALTNAMIDIDYSVIG